MEFKRYKKELELSKKEDNNSEILKKLELFNWATAEKVIHLYLNNCILRSMLEYNEFLSRNPLTSVNRRIEMLR